MRISLFNTAVITAAVIATNQVGAVAIGQMPQAYYPQQPQAMLQGAYENTMMPAMVPGMAAQTTSYQMEQLGGMSPQNEAMMQQL